LQYCSDENFKVVKYPPKTVADLHYFYYSRIKNKIATQNPNKES